MCELQKFLTKHSRVTNSTHKADPYSVDARIAFSGLDVAVDISVGVERGDHCWKLAQVPIQTTERLDVSMLKPLPDRDLSSKPLNEMNTGSSKHYQVTHADHLFSCGSCHADDFDCNLGMAKLT